VGDATRFSGEGGTLVSSCNRGSQAHVEQVHACIVFNVSDRSTRVSRTQASPFENAGPQVATRSLACAFLGS